jgi:rhodanese-related sulfurtransferase
MIKVTAPNERFKREENIFIFLAGSIDNGEADNWQDNIIEELFNWSNIKDDDNIVILNPRREDWNKDIDPTQRSPYLISQINWELRGMEASDIILFYFTKDSKAPISLLELGLNINKKNKKIIVYCEEGFYRQINIEETCKRYNVDFYLDSITDISLDNILVEEIDSILDTK